MYSNQYFQTICQFTSARVSQYKDLASVSQDLEKIAPLFNARQLSVQISSQFPILAEGLQNFFKTHQGLKQLYSSKISALPVDVAVASKPQPPTLVLKGNSVVGQSEEQYKLS